MTNRGVSKFIDTLDLEEIEKGNKIGHEEHERQYREFVSNYKKGICYLCGKDFKSFGSNSVCMHSLLRRNKFKKKNFKDIYQKWGYFNISSYLRRVANQEGFIKNINDLEEEKGVKKKFQYTIRWQNIDWTFSCCNSDFEGHKGTKSDFPHYHFQMRINNMPFIDFTDFHIPFKDYDLRMFEAKDDPRVKHSWGSGGIGIQEAMDNLELLEDGGVDSMFSTEDENKAQFHLSTIIRGPISGEQLDEIIKEAKESGKTLAATAKKNLGENSVQTIISPADTIKDILARE